MKKSNPNRDRKGRFLAKGKRDPVDEAREKMYAERCKLAATYVKICGAIGHPKLSRLLGIKRDAFPGRRGNWKIGDAAAPFFAGLLSGIYFITCRRQKKGRALGIVSLMEEARAISKNVTRFKREFDRLV